MELILLKLDFPDSSVGKEAAYNEGEHSSTPGLGRSPGEGIGYPVFFDLSCGSACKESTCNEGDLGLIPSLGRSPGEGKGYPLQCSGLEVVKLGMTEQLSLSLFFSFFFFISWRLITL